jgi:hypothetical protein
MMINQRAAEFFGNDAAQQVIKPLAYRRDFEQPYAAL